MVKAGYLCRFKSYRYGFSAAITLCVLRLLLNQLLQSSPFQTPSFHRQPSADGQDDSEHHPSVGRRHHQSLYVAGIEPRHGQFRDLKLEEYPPIVDLEALPYVTDEHYRTPKCPKTVSSLTRYSKWFRERYRPNIKIFLEESDITNFDSYFKFLHYWMPYGLRNANVRKLWSIANHRNFSSSRLDNHKTCHSCAVIGSGGNINGSGAGPEINSHDYVFRLNHATIREEYANDVGNKTSFYTFFPESMYSLDLDDKDANFFYLLFKPYDLDYLINLLNDVKPPMYVIKGKQFLLRKPKIDPRKLRIIHPDFFRYVFTKFLDGKSKRPTTGAIVVLMALHLCDDVTIYGFGYDQRFTLHYYDKTFRAHTDTMTALHDVDNERKLWSKLHEEGIIRFFKRDT